MNRTTSGIDIELDGEHKPITEVINTFEMVGDEVRANLVAAIRAVVMEAKEARRVAHSYALAEQQIAQ